MSDLKIKIIFTDDKRSFRGGDVVSGEVVVKVRKRTDCRSLLLGRYWATDGKGNEETGSKNQVKLFSGIWEPGTTYRYPFAVSIPQFPITYHGHLLQIDHYVEAKAILPGSRDPNVTESIVVLPGGVGPDESPARWEKGELPAERRIRAGVSRPGLVITIILFSLSLFAAFTPPGTLLFLVGLAVLAWTMRSKLAERRIGKVGCTVGPSRVGPGDDVRVRLSFLPPSSTKIQGVSLTLTCQETCVSGSGKKRRVHHHFVLKEKGELIGTQFLPGGKKFVVDGQVAIPETDAHSFYGKDNKLEWTLTTSVAIPRWPDWQESTPLQVRQEALAELPISKSKDIDPMETRIVSPQLPSPEELQPDLQPVSQPEFPSPPAIPVPPPPLPLIAPAESLQPIEEDSSEDVGGEVEDSPSEPTAVGTAGSLLEAIQLIREQDQYGAERTALTDTLKGRVFAFSLNLKRVDWTFGSGDSAYQGGRTVVGTIVGSEVRVSVRCFPEGNALIDGLKAPDEVDFIARVADWSVLHNSPEMSEDRAR